MYCKDKIYTGTEEFSFEELRAARIFAFLRETGKCNVERSLQEDVKHTNFKVMYPKNEVYSFYGENQLEEVCLKRYYAYKESKKQMEETMLMQKDILSSSEDYSQTQPRNSQICPEQAVNRPNHPGLPVDVPLGAMLNPEMLQSQNRPNVADRNVSLCVQDESMEITSCKKVNKEEHDCHDQPPKTNNPFKK